MKFKINYGLVKERLIIAILATKLSILVLQLIQEISFISVAFNYDGYDLKCTKKGGIASSN